MREGEKCRLSFNTRHKFIKQVFSWRCTAEVCKSVTEKERFPDKCLGIAKGLWQVRDLGAY